VPSANPQVHRDASRRWRQTHPDLVKEQKRRYYERHTERLRALQNPGNLARARQLRRDVLAALGNLCIRCGFDDWRALQIDHIHGSGRADRARFANLSQYFRAVIAEPEKYQILCSNCNWIKRYEQNEHRWGSGDGRRP
jgi:hypothetical protein